MINLFRLSKYLWDSKWEIWKWYIFRSFLVNLSLSISLIYYIWFQFSYWFDPKDASAFREDMHCLMHKKLESNVILFKRKHFVMSLLSCFIQYRKLTSCTLFLSGYFEKSISWNFFSIILKKIVKILKSVCWFWKSYFGELF